MAQKYIQCGGRKEYGFYWKHTSLTLPQILYILPLKKQQFFIHMLVDRNKLCKSFNGLKIKISKIAYKINYLLIVCLNYSCKRINSQVASKRTKKCSFRNYPLKLYPEKWHYKKKKNVDEY